MQRARGSVNRKRGAIERALPPPLPAPRHNRPEDPPASPPLRAKAAHDGPGRAYSPPLFGGGYSARRFETSRVPTQQRPDVTVRARARAGDSIE